jgi:transcription elongation factor Elf1
MTKRASSDGARPEPCPSCGTELVVIGLVVDGTNLVMRSCATCDTRAWHLGRQAVDVGTVLAAVGHDASRRRPERSGGPAGRR